ncbi:VOC family protein [Arthrobacter sp. MI7-26]|uniref:VOC family protein n=1 Tax=Arthrobacter sp. MI7-26 TaxID=2993653 RepID=UPI0022496ABD|nr:VOC family protein [Arthrobacter sp. MI7-26]MCX2748051.1 VOC family protein [Arthrobacter sp. MI7-26]
MSKTESSTEKVTPLQKVGGKTSAGLPGLLGTDHIGFTVPDIEEAHRFFVDVLGCEYVYSFGPFLPEGDWMKRHLNIHPEAVMREARFYRCGNGSNYEVFHYEAPNQQMKLPLNSDVGGFHLALYVTDLDAAITYLVSCGIRVLGESTSSKGPSYGKRWVYFLSPWGQQFELVSFPDGKAYEKDSDVLLWDVRA